MILYSVIVTQSHLRLIGSKCMGESAFILICMETFDIWTTENISNSMQNGKIAKWQIPFFCWIYLHHRLGMWNVLIDVFDLHSNIIHQKWTKMNILHFCGKSQCHEKLNFKMSKICTKIIGWVRHNELIRTYHPAVLL